MREGSVGRVRGRFARPTQPTYFVSFDEHPGGVEVEAHVLELDSPAGDVHLDGHDQTPSMGFSIDFGDEQQDAVIVRTSGAATVEGFREGNQALVGDPRFQPGMPILVDNTALDTTGLTAADVRAIGEPPVALGERVGTSPIAVVAPDPFVRGDVRMSYTHASQPACNVRIFHSLAEAVVWIRAQSPAR